MRIAFVCQYFVPEIGAPSARVSELCREWVAQGHEVTVITALPNHPTGIVPLGPQLDFSAPHDRAGFAD